jgi:hypothetical protein
MGQTLTLRLADGTEIQGEVEGSLSSRALDLLNAAGATPLRLTATESDADAADADVEGHGGVWSLQVRISDDVEGHAFSLRLPDAASARETQKRLLAGGALVGVIVVGAAVAQTGLPDLSVGAAPGSAPAPVTRSVEFDQAHAPGGAAGAFGVSTTDPRSDVGIMDASGAAIVGEATAPTRGADDDIGLMDPAGAAAGGVVRAGAVHPGQTRTDLRTDSPAAVNTGESAKRASGSGAAVEDIQASDESSHPPMPGEPHAR